MSFTGREVSHFTDACELLSHHRPRSPRGAALNRLFQKHVCCHAPDLLDLAPLPILDESCTLTALETWTKQRLSDVAPAGIRDRAPSLAEPPLVIVRYLGVDYLIDGGSRISTWRRSGLIGSHQVYVIEYVPKGSGP